MTGEIVKWVVAILGSAAGGGALMRWIMPTTRRIDRAAAAQAEAGVDRTRADTRKAVTEEVSAQVAAVNGALDALADTIKTQRGEFTARDEGNKAQISELKVEVRALRALFRSYVTWSRPAIDAWRRQHPDYPDPPELDY